MKKALFIIPPELFRDEEINIPLNILMEGNVKVAVASLKSGNIIGTKGSIIKSDLLINDAGYDDFDAFIIVGGAGTKKHLWNEPELHHLLRKAYMNNQLIAGICAGSVVLAKAGLLKGIKATTFQSEDYIEELEKNGAIYTGKDLEEHGNIITANGPLAASEFGQAILNNLQLVSDHNTRTIPGRNPFNDL